MVNEARQNYLSSLFLWGEERGFSGKHGRGQTHDFLTLFVLPQAYPHAIMLKHSPPKYRIQM